MLRRHAAHCTGGSNCHSSPSNYSYSPIFNCPNPFPDPFTDPFTDTAQQRRLIQTVRTVPMTPHRPLEGTREAQVVNDPRQVAVRTPTRH